MYAHFERKLNIDSNDLITLMLLTIYSILLIKDFCTESLRTKTTTLVCPQIYDISQLIRFSFACLSFEDINCQNLIFTKNLLKQEYRYTLVRL